MLAAFVAVASSLAAAECAQRIEGSQCKLQPAADHPYVLGDTVRDTLSSTVCLQLYRFTIGGQQNVRIALTSPGLETFLQMLDQRGAIIMNSLLTSTVDTATTERMMLGAGGYSLLVRPVHNGRSGTYRLVTTPDNSAVGGCSSVWVTPGITTTQSITSADCTSSPLGGRYRVHAYSIVLLSGQVVTLSEYSTAFPPGFVLSGPDGTQSSSPDSLGTTAGLTYQVASQGRYGLFVGSTDTNRVGSYTLQVQ